LPEAVVSSACRVRVRSARVCVCAPRASERRAQPASVCELSNRRMRSCDWQSRVRVRRRTSAVVFASTARVRRSRVRRAAHTARTPLKRARLAQLHAHRHAARPTPRAGRQPSTHVPHHTPQKHTDHTQPMVTCMGAYPTRRAGRDPERACRGTTRRARSRQRDRAHARAHRGTPPPRGPAPAGRPPTRLPTQNGVRSRPALRRPRPHTPQTMRSAYAVMVKLPLPTARMAECGCLLPHSPLHRPISYL
jgi:hypothetical protein